MNEVLVNTEIRPPKADTEIEEMIAVRLRAAVNAYSNAESPSALEVERHYSDKNGVIAEGIRCENLKSLCAKIGNHIVGMCVWNNVGDNTVIVEYLYVEPSLQNTGIGGLLLKEMLKIINGNETVHLSTQGAQEFYATHGFFRTGLYTDDGITHEEEMVRPPAM